VQEAVAPLVALRLADLVTGAQFSQRHGGFESFKDDLQLLGAAPFAAFHFGGFFQAAHSLTLMQLLTGGGIIVSARELAEHVAEGMGLGMQVELDGRRDRSVRLIPMGLEDRTRVEEQGRQGSSDAVGQVARKLCVAVWPVMQGHVIGAIERMATLYTKLHKLAAKLGVPTIKSLGYETKEAFVQKRLYLLKSYP
jgi:hypothetical protein